MIRTEEIGVLHKILDQSENISRTIGGSIYRKNFKSEQFKRLVGEIYEDLEDNRLDDPYWPKWDSPWWKILLLYETDHIDMIDKGIIKRFINIIDSHYLHFFPIRESELPEGINPYTDIICFCALGSIIKIAASKDIPVLEEFSWIKDVIKSNILDDGGFNCDESVYTTSRKSSLISTLSILEALFDYERFTDEYKGIVDNGINYFLKRDLFFTSHGKIMDKKWIKPIFPRFYEVDILRILTFIVNWSYKRGKRLDENILFPAVSSIKQSENENGYIVIKREWLKQEGTLINVDGKWIFTEKASYFELLQKLSSIERPSHFLTREWHSTLKRLINII